MNKLRLASYPALQNRLDNWVNWISWSKQNSRYPAGSYCYITLSLLYVPASFRKLFSIFKSFPHFFYATLCLWRNFDNPRRNHFTLLKCIAVCIPAKWGQPGNSMQVVYWGYYLLSKACLRSYYLVVLFPDSLCVGFHPQLHLFGFFFKTLNGELFGGGESAMILMCII